MDTTYEYICIGKSTDIRMLCNGVAVNTTDEYICIGESTVICMLCNGVAVNTTYEYVCIGESNAIQNMRSTHLQKVQQLI
jgi:hypothetical protein